MREHLMRAIELSNSLDEGTDFRLFFDKCDEKNHLPSDLVVIVNAVESTLAMG
jgi:hypothetical protein